MHGGKLIIPSCSNKMKNGWKKKETPANMNHMLLTKSTLCFEVAWMKGNAPNTVLCSSLSFPCPAHRHLVKWSPGDTACRVAITHHAFSRSAKQQRRLNTAYLISIERVRRERQHFGLLCGCANALQHMDVFSTCATPWENSILYESDFFCLFLSTNISHKNILPCRSELAAHMLSYTVFKWNDRWQNL